MHQEAITRAAIRNINISQRRNEREKPHNLFAYKVNPIETKTSRYIEM